MPNSSTFITKKKVASYNKYLNKSKVLDKLHFVKTTNEVCFASMNKNSEINYVIIEKEKQIFPKEMITEYLDDLMKIEQLLIESYSFRKNNSLYIKIKPIGKNKSEMTSQDHHIFVLTVTFIRYLYEGSFGFNSRIHDEFYHAINCYFALKKFELGDNIFQRLLFATNYIFLKSQERININHLPCNETGCNIFFDINKKDSLRSGLNYSISNSSKYGYLSIHKGSSFEPLCIKNQIKKVPNLENKEEVVSFVNSCSEYSTSFGEKYQKLKKEIDDRREKQRKVTINSFKLSSVAP